MPDSDNKHMEASRRKVRAAISELFLDTALDNSDFDRLCCVLLDSHLPIEELDRIYYQELAPLLHGNLKTVAGEWSGFDIDWIETEISKKSKEPHQSIFAKFRRHWETRETQAEWDRLRGMLAARLAQGE